jgi:hypothetical protein
MVWFSNHGIVPDMIAMAKGYLWLFAPLGV